MDFKQIQELIKMVNKSNIGEVTIEQKDFRITIKQKEEHVTQMYCRHAAPVYQLHHSQLANLATAACSRTAEKPKAAEAATCKYLLP